MNADALLEHYTRQIDNIVVDCGVQVAQQLLDAGAKVEDLRSLMQPIFQHLANWRAGALAKLQCDVAAIRAVELRMAAIEAQIERLESRATVH